MILSGHRRIVFTCLLFLLTVLAWAPANLALSAGTAATGTIEQPVIDSNMTVAEAFEGLDQNCPADIRARQVVVEVKYYSSDQKVHQGQLVVDAEVADDIRQVFDLALKERFPIHSVIPISDQRFRKDGRWDDDLSMDANNTSAFNYRLVTGGTRLSKHAYGRAIDINPRQNPYIKGDTILPKGASYDPVNDKGALAADHPIVRAFLRLGWDWGGNWTSLKDYQHFEKPLKKH